jgi:hypothetical protein
MKIMKTKDEIIKEQIGIALNAIETTPMDKGECKKCMTAWGEQLFEAFGNFCKSINEQTP